MTVRKSSVPVKQVGVDPQPLAAQAPHETTGFDGLERISTQTLMDLLEVPQRRRTGGTYRQLAKVMAQLGWAAVRVRDFNGRGFKQVRGYVRDVRAVQ